MVEKPRGMLILTRDLKAKPGLDRDRLTLVWPTTLRELTDTIRLISAQEAGPHQEWLREPANIYGLAADATLDTPARLFAWYLDFQSAPVDIALDDSGVPLPTDDRWNTFIDLVGAWTQPFSHWLDCSSERLALRLLLQIAEAEYFMKTHSQCFTMTYAQSVGAELAAQADGHDTHYS